MSPINYSFTNHIFNIYIYIYKWNLVLNNLQELIGHQTQPTNQPILKEYNCVQITETPQTICRPVSSGCKIR